MRVFALIASCGLVALAAPAMSQTTNTNCMRVGNQVFCNSYTTPQVTVPPPVYYTPPAYQPAPMGVNPILLQMLIAKRQREAAERQRQAQLQAEQAAAEQRAAQESADTAFRTNLGKMIEAGDCPGARRAALDVGRLDMAALVTQACAAVAPPATPAAATAPH